MEFPEQVKSVGTDKFVVRIGWDGLCKWWVLGNHDEQDDTCSEQVNDWSMVGLAQVDFWSHIALSTSSSFIDSLCGCESKVSNFKCELMIEKDVLRFDISV